jgi:AmmeMemoRadiSam system protein A
VDDYPLGRLRDYPLVGVFVTLRKNADLRGCIGNFAAATPLSQALAQAATGVVSRDARFPAVTPDELPELTLSVSLLHTRELLDEDPHVRVAQVVIGKHGLDIQFQGQKGLLLPSVATDFGLDPVGFLQAVCRKAHLPDGAWQDPQATLYRFSAIVLGGAWTADSRRPE